MERAGGVAVVTCGGVQDGALTGVSPATPHQLQMARRLSPITGHRIQIQANTKVIQ